MEKLTNFNEVIDRLLDNGFYFDIEGNKLIIHSHPNREARNAVLGFSYWGRQEDYVYELNGITVSDIIYEAHQKYKKLVVEYFSEAIKNI